ncbi:MAG TPA: ABC transporter ATP-binding protein [bacterium]|nr:ABC transporter ATP-binding protein [bacterium]HNS49080.1 ABC transporter ATP-binding protein [bacterium]
MSRLKVSGLRVAFRTPGGRQEILRGLDLEVRDGEIVGLCGESGAGKSLLVLSVLGLLPPGAEFVAGRIEFEGRELTGHPDRAARLRGRELAVVFQDPTASLDPLYRAGNQVAEALAALGRPAGRSEVVRCLAATDLKEPDRLAWHYPHQLSGGEKQRVVLAISLAGRPRLLLADEPTASLDSATSDQVTGLLNRIRREQGTSILFISHNLPLVAGLADRIAIIYAGTLLEIGPARSLVERPLHPYTRLLYAALPDPGRRGQPLATVIGRPGQPSEADRGCVFFERCPDRRAACAAERPVIKEIFPDHRVACFRAGQPD